MTTRILIVDDHPAVREGLAVRIASQADLEVCGEAADVGDALELLAATRPDVAVVDIQLKTGDGLELIKRIKARDESVRILVWSVYPDKLYAERALNAGALGYINKEHTTGRIVEAIRRVRDGKVYLCDEMAETLLSQTVGGTRSLRDSPIKSLSDRELEVFRLIGEGVSTAELAERLHLSRHTIDTHRQRIKEKLNLASAAELTQTAIRWVLQGERGSSGQTEPL
jgi:DNA-binding NarL/FixJ family response regulator